MGGNRELSILEKEVWVGINRNSKYYENLGYTIPKTKDNWGRKTTPRGTKILVKVEDLLKTSDVKVTKICDDCGNHIPNQKYNWIDGCRKNSDGKDRCYNCGITNAGKLRKKNVKYQNTLEYFARHNNKKYLLDEFSDRNTKKPNEISWGTHDIFWWNCPNCESEYDVGLSNRTYNGNNCPYCDGKRVNHTNCIWTTHPEIAKLLKNHNQGYQITAGSNQKVKFVCEKCNSEQNKVISGVTKKGFSCSKCSDGISYPEKFMICLLNQLEVDFETQKIFNWSVKKKYDFYLSPIKSIIETHGKQHYEESFCRLGGRTLKEEQYNDKLKEEIALKNGIENYIPIDCRYSEMKWIKESILKSDINKLFDLSNVNWSKCHEYACSSLVKTACDLWNNGIKSTEELGKQIKVNRNTVVRYLKQGADIGLCQYDSKIALKQNGCLSGQKSKKTVIQLGLNGEFIKEWKSFREAIYIYNTGISMVCKGKRKSACGFKWMYKEDYDQYIKQVALIRK
jgi:hypothetical protein